MVLKLACCIYKKLIKFLKRDSKILRRSSTQIGEWTKKGQCNFLERLIFYMVLIDCLDLTLYGKVFKMHVRCMCDKKKLSGQKKKKRW